MATHLKTTGVEIASTFVTAKVWCRYRQAAGAEAVMDSYGVSSVTDNSTGKWTTNFSSTQTNASYSVLYTSEDDRFQTLDNSTSATTTTCKCRTTHYNGNAYDMTINNILIMGD